MLEPDSTAAQLSPLRLRIGLLIRALTVGGAERQLVSVARGLHAAGHDVEIMIFYRADTRLERDAEAAGIAIVALGKRGRWDVFGFLQRLHAHARDRSLDVIYSFLPTSNVLASLMWGTGPRPRVVWGIRGDYAAPGSHDWLGIALSRLEKLLARRPAAIIVNSQTGLEERCAQGWPAERLYMVRNGIDADAFAFDPDARAKERAAWSVAPAVPVIGIAGRLDPVKGIEIFFDALRAIGEQVGDLEVAIAGTGPERYTASLQRLAGELGLADRVRWLGNVTGMAGFYSSIDLLCLPSLSEGCSNVVAEALACGTPVVATRSGDNGVLIDDPRLLAVPGDEADLARALRAGLHTLPTANRTALRALALDRLSAIRMVNATERILTAAATPGAERGVATSRV